jgi:hypothetical protein
MAFGVNEICKDMASQVHGIITIYQASHGLNFAP